MSINAVVAVPENNTTLFEEVSAYCSEFDSIRLARVPRPHRPLTVDDLPEYRERTLEVVTPLIGEGVDIVIYGCTSAGFLAGPSGNDEFVAALAELTGAPVVSTANAMIEVLRASGVRTIDLLSPYLDWKNQSLISYLEAYGIAVLHTASFEARNPSELSTITAEQVLERAEAIVSPESEGVFIACTQLPTLPVIDTLRARFEKPVWSATRATAWSALSKLGLDADRLARRREPALAER